MDCPPSARSELERILLDESAKPKSLPLSLLKEITNNFSYGNIIGSGGFAVVYKGMLDNGIVVVKKLSESLDIDDKRFREEIGNLMMAKHKNVVRCLGLCADTQGEMSESKGKFVMGEVRERLICFEYLRNGSLDKKIKDASPKLEWSQRYKIIVGICDSLYYLHNKRILHLDLKPGNILLDDSMMPKIADFGLSRCFDEDQSFAITSKAIGTKEYMPPEFIREKVITFKYDIYSLGIIIIEMLTGSRGRPNIDNVLEWWRKRLEKMHEVTQLNQIRVCTEIGIQCTKTKKERRPDIKDIVVRLGATKSVEDFSTKTMTVVPPAGPTIRQNECSSSMLDDNSGVQHVTGIGETTSDVEEEPIIGRTGETERHRQHNPANNPGKQLMDGEISIRRKVDIHYATKFMEHILLDTSMEPIYVPLALLKHITEDFSDKRCIERGGFGDVYKGHLQNGSVVVKRLSNAYKIDEGLFYRETTILIGVKHENIVRLLAYCADTEFINEPNHPRDKRKLFSLEIIERLLCFEYIRNGSLDKYLTDYLSGLEWHTCYGIIKGICNGLDYLHNEKGIIHGGLQPANIMVDDFMVPKIKVFGISKLLDGVTHAVSSNTTMALGYTAPELILRGELSFKSDMYSLGVIITELVTGHKGDYDIKNVLGRWRHMWNKSVIYPPFGIQQVTKCLEMASRCLSDSPNKRPSARGLLIMLNASERTEASVGTVHRHFRNFYVDEDPDLEVERERYYDGKRFPRLHM